jgi:hypothetical protein
MTPANDYYSRPPFVNPDFLRSLDSPYGPGKAAPATSGYIVAVPTPAPPLPSPAISDPATEPKFFMVFRDNGGSPTAKHTTIASAEKEADRLARLNPGSKFHVLSSVESVLIPVQPKPAGVWRSAR